MADDVSVSISRYLVDLARTPQVPQTALDVMRLSFLDWLAVGSAGQEEPVSKIVRSFCLDEAGVGEVSVFGSDVKLPARAAALINGTVSHALDYDDTHFIHIGHPSCVVASAALAMGERVGASGDDILMAVLLGCEASCRVGDWFGHSHYQQGFHQTATAGTFGAVVAVGRLLSLDDEQLSHAIGLASTRASGLKSQFGTMGKPYHAGMAASNGVEACLLAAKGFVSRPDGLECAQGFAATHGCDPSNTTHIGDGSFLFETVQHKFHACCHGTHAALEAIHGLIASHNLAPSDIHSMVLTVHPRWLNVCHIEAPTTGLEAKFSYRLTAAMACLGYDTAALSTFNDALCFDSVIVALRDKVCLETDESVCETYARVTMNCSAGGVVSAEHDLNTPMAYEMREKKIRIKAASLVGEEKANRFWEMLSAPDVMNRPLTLSDLLVSH